MLLLLAVALMSFVWTPFEVGSVNTDARLLKPGAEGHLLGTDNLGRDIASQIMAGARNSLYVALLSSTAAVLAGVTLGSVAATAGGALDEIVGRLSDVIFAFPGLLLALLLAVKLGPGNTSAIVAIAVTSIPTVTRLTRSVAKQAYEQDYVEAAMSYGRNRWYILVRHILPNVSNVIIVQASLLFALAIVIEASLAYLGLGAQPPTASWGRMLQESQPLFQFDPMLSVWPGTAIMLSILGFNLLGDGLRDALDPQLRRRLS